MTVPAAIADPTVGAPAPEFTLPSTAGRTVRVGFQVPVEFKLPTRH